MLEERLEEESRLDTEAARFGTEALPASVLNRPDESPRRR